MRKIVLISMSREFGNRILGRYKSIMCSSLKCIPPFVVITIALILLSVETKSFIELCFSLQALTDQCMRFALNHMTQIVQSEAFDQLESSLAKNFVQKAAGLGAFNS